MTESFLHKGHVYFGCEDQITRENSILVLESSTDVIDIHLGFLQYHHKYSLTVEVPKVYLRGWDIRSLLLAAENSPPNRNCRVVSISDGKDYFVFTVEFFAEKERLMKEELNLNFGGAMMKTLQFNARVLGPGKGTPLLKNEIRCIGISHDDMSEASDWQG